MNSGTWQTEEWLRQKYTVEGLDCPTIGRMVNRDAKTVWYWLRKYGIPTRPRGSNVGQLPKGAMKGKHHTEETKRKVGEASRARGAVPYLRNGVHFNKGKRGNVVANWKGGITPERQTFYRSQEWKDACKVVWQRADAKCERCGLDHRTIDRKTQSFHVHHIESFANRERRADTTNLVLLCDTCHRWVHSKANVTGEYLR